MASAAISIVDRLIQLATVREKNREKYFKNFIEPLYLDGEQIAKDYMSLLTELIHRIGQANDGREIVEWLETKRTALQPLRTKVRALIGEGFMKPRKEPVGDAAALFMKGLWELLKGGISSIDGGHALTSEYGFGSHTVLDLLQSARVGSMLTPKAREFLTGQARGQQQALERAWQDVANAYAELRRMYLG
jgi:hypothetical protein